jgi:DNA-binding HxlR family transcriptional regulator
LRAGGQALTLLGNPRNSLVLRSLSEGAKDQRDLRRDVGFPAPSTLRGHLEALENAGVVDRRRRDASPSTLEYDLTDAGQELLAVAASLGRWLATAPRHPIELGSDPAKAAIKGLVEGWSAAVLTTLAGGPLSLTELDKRISAISYPSLERCLDTMRLAEQLDVGKRTRRGTPYTLTDWLRRGLAPLALGARWEHRHRPDGVDEIDHSDIDGALLLGGPLFKLSGRVSGVCQLVVKIPDGKKQQRHLGFVEVQSGRISFRAVYPQVKPDAWASGTADTWFAAVIDADPSGLKMSGDSDLADAVLDGLHQALFEDGAGEADRPSDVAESEAQG